MEAVLSVDKNIMTQFAEQLRLEEAEGKVKMDNPLGTGSMRFFAFPNQLELYEFHFHLKQPFRMRSSNPVSSEWLLLNINLSDRSLEKKVNNQTVDIQKFLPSGILIYTPGTQVESESPPGIPFRVAIVRMHRQFLNHYAPGLSQKLFRESYSVIYEDLDFHAEETLTGAIDAAEDKKMLAHAKLLTFTSHFFEKLSHREDSQGTEQLHPDDLKGLFVACSYLRNPAAKEVPPVEQLASIAMMGETKFRATFKQVFGLAPIQYHSKIKMDYAKDQLLQKRKTPSELSYELGYSHPSKFTAAYKRHFDILPSETPGTA